MARISLTYYPILKQEGHKCGSTVVLSWNLLSKKKKNEKRVWLIEAKNKKNIRKYDTTNSMHMLNPLKKAHQEKMPIKWIPSGKKPLRKIAYVKLSLWNQSLDVMLLPLSCRFRLFLHLSCNEILKNICHFSISPIIAHLDQKLEEGVSVSCC